MELIIMKQKFFTSTIETNFIKSLLYNTPLPTCNTVSTNDYLIVGQTYIYNRSVIKCTKSGYLCNPFKILLSYKSLPLGKFILGSTMLGDLSIEDYNSYLKTVCSGTYIDNNKYYLLGEYDLRYGLTDSDPDYPIFDSLQSYAEDDIVQYTKNGHTYLYKALLNLSAGTQWNDADWQYISAPKTPFKLIQCLEPGIIDAIPAGSLYVILQASAPLILPVDAGIKISPHTYYLSYQVVDTSVFIQLLYNDNATTLSNDVAEWQIKSSYIPQQFYPQFTSRYISLTDYYDSETHYQLGQLLRFYKDIYQINLLPFYNCWNGSEITGYKLQNDKLVASTESAYRLIKVPIKFNKKYTIAIDSASEIKIIPALIRLNELIKVQIGTSDKILLNNLLDDPSTLILGQTSFQHPFAIEITNKSQRQIRDIEPSAFDTTLISSQFLQRYEKNLCLIIQIPANNTSSIVVLEGDYTNVQTNKIFNIENLGQISPIDLDFSLLKNLSLLALNDQCSYPYADRLIEYLLLNVITGQDTIGDNIIRIRQQLKDLIHYDNASREWSDYLRILIYDLMNSQQVPIADLNGFVDKDSEVQLELIGQE